MSEILKSLPASSKVDGYSLKDVGRVFLPNKILSRLGEHLARTQGFHLTTNPQNTRLGQVEVSLTGFEFIDLAEVVREFYAGEGYSVLEIRPGFLKAQDSAGEVYDISLSIQAKHLRVFVRQSAAIR